MPKSHSLFLTDIEDLDHFRYLPHLGEFGILPLAVENGLQLEGYIEVILERSFSPAGYKEYLFDTRSDSLLHDIVNQWLVDKR
jgi:hypothetical protein